jgi:hypothetical protein
MEKYKSYRLCDNHTGLVFHRSDIPVSVFCDLGALQKLSANLKDYRISEAILHLFEGKMKRAIALSDNRVQ